MMPTEPTGRPANRAVRRCQVGERQRLAGLLEEQLQALQVPRHRYADAMLPISDRVRATVADECGEVSPAKPHRSTRGHQGLGERRHIHTRRLLAEERMERRSVLELGRLLAKFPMVDGIG